MRRNQKRSFTTKYLQLKGYQRIITLATNEMYCYIRCYNYSFAPFLIHVLFKLN